MTKCRKYKRRDIQASRITLLIHKEAIILQPEGRIHTDNTSNSLYITVLTKGKYCNYDRVTGPSPPCFITPRPRRV